MVDVQPFACPSCGAVLSAGGGRCPHCGTQLPASLPAGPSPAAIVGTRLSGAPPRPKPKRALLVPVSASLILLGAVGFFAYWFGVRKAPEPPAVPAMTVSAMAATPGEPFVADAGGPDLNATLVQAKVRATAWDRDALLVKAVFSPVVAGTVDLAGGATVEVTYGKPAGERLGPAARVGPQRLVVTSDAAGTHTEVQTDPSAARAVAEPNCTFNQAWRAMTAAGLDPNVQVTLRYERSEKHDRGVWIAELAGDPTQTRTVDGSSCNLLVR